MEQIPLKLEKSDIAIIADDVVKEKLTFSINLIANIGNFFRTAAPEVKIRVVGSIFPKNLEFDGKKYRIRQLNNLVHVISHETKRLQGKEIVESSENSEDSTWVPPLGIKDFLLFPDVSSKIRIIAHCMAYQSESSGS